MPDSKKVKALRKRKKQNPAGAYLTRLREGKGYSLDDWAAVTDYNKSTVCRFETAGPVPVAFILAAMSVPPNPATAKLTPQERAALEHARRSQASRKAAATVRAAREKRKRAAQKAARARATKPARRKPARGRRSAGRVRRLQTRRDLPPGDVVAGEVAAAAGAL